LHPLYVPKNETSDGGFAETKKDVGKRISHRRAKLSVADGFDLAQFRDQGRLRTEVRIESFLADFDQHYREAAVTVALRGAPVSSDISPNTSPGNRRPMVPGVPQSSVR
jgi:hypothetical protein